MSRTVRVAVGKSRRTNEIAMRNAFEIMTGLLLGSLPEVTLAPTGLLVEYRKVRVSGIH